MMNTPKPLTNYLEGSVRELFAVTFPLMLSVLSGSLMMFFDRLVLAKYSLDAMNTASAASMTCMFVLYGTVSIATIAEVFVGQYNGSQNYSQVARPTWQMVWFSLFCAIPLLVVARWGGPYLLSPLYYQEFGLPYFQWTLYLGLFMPLQAAFAAFFIGLGKVRLVTIVAILANVVNVGLDIVLVFGVSPWIPAMGPKGAAIATGSALGLQVALLVLAFLSSHNRKAYQTHRYSLDVRLLWRCLRIGTPSAIAHMIEIGAWALNSRMMMSVGPEYITVLAIGQSVYALIGFGMEGLQKGVTAIAANFIGSKQWDKVTQTWRSAVKLLFLMAVVFGTFLVVFPNLILSGFLSQGEMVANENLLPLLKIVCLCVWIYFIFDGLTWVSAGVLTAAGDTAFVMMINALSSWLCALTPIYIFVVLLRGSPAQAWIFLNFYGLMNALIFYLRFRQGKWKTRGLLIEEKVMDASA